MVGIEAWVMLLATHNPCNERFLVQSTSGICGYVRHRPAVAHHDRKACSDGIRSQQEGKSHTSEVSSSSSECGF